MTRSVPIIIFCKNARSVFVMYLFIAPTNFSVFMVNDSVKEFSFCDTIFDDMNSYVQGAYS